MGLWDTAMEVYNKLPDGFRPKFRNKGNEIIFPSGAKLTMKHMELVKDKFNHQGLQYSAIYFDEGTQFEWEQVEYLMSRMRSSAEGNSYMMVSCNPDPDSWILPLIEWYLDDEGYPDQTKDGVFRWFVSRDGSLVFRDTPEELLEEYGDDCEPLSFTFISATIYDNPVMMRENPKYKAFLEGLNEVDKARLLHGNWYARARSSTHFDRQWVEEVPAVPRKAKRIRAWDLASTEKSDVNRNPDFTAGVRMSKDADGYYYIEHATRMRKRAGSRDLEMMKIAKQDGSDCIVSIPVDAGAAGKTAAFELGKKFISEGYRVKKVPTTNKSKITRFEPFSSAAENGLVKIVKSSFPTLQDYEDFLKELEAFDGSGKGHDDWVDACADAYNLLSKETYIPSFTIGSITQENKFKAS